MSSDDFTTKIEAACRLAAASFPGSTEGRRSRVDRYAVEVVVNHLSIDDRRRYAFGICFFILLRVDLDAARAAGRSVDEQTLNAVLAPYRDGLDSLFRGSARVFAQNVYSLSVPEQPPVNDKWYSSLWAVRRNPLAPKAKA